MDGYKITAFTKFSEELCLMVLDLVEREFGEIGDFLIEDGGVSFRVYPGYFEDAAKIIRADGLKLRLFDKFDYANTVYYDIIPKRSAVKRNKWNGI